MRYGSENFAARLIHQLVIVFPEAEYCIKPGCGSGLGTYLTTLDALVTEIKDAGLLSIVVHLTRETVLFVVCGLKRGLCVILLRSGKALNYIGASHCNVCLTDIAAKIRPLKESTFWLLRSLASRSATIDGHPCQRKHG